MTPSYFFESWRRNFFHAVNLSHHLDSKFFSPCNVNGEALPIDLLGRSNLQSNDALPDQHCLLGKR